jgi:uncharacterized membrane protein
VTRDLSLVRVVEVVLTLGVAASGVLLLLGLILGRDGVLRTGIVLMMLTPVARVAIMTFGLFQEGDRRFGFVSLAVLAVLVAGIVLSRQ